MIDRTTSLLTVVLDPDNNSIEAACHSAA